MITPEEIGAPRIPPPPQDEPGRRRPFWSVMVPVYNRVSSLPQALRSVASQLPAAKAAAAAAADDDDDEPVQIEVVDDASDSPTAVQEVVQAAGDPRITLHRNERRLGMVGNWNQCLARARGRWVHLLHDDDFVRPGFYAALRAAIETRDEVGMAFTDTVKVNQAGEQISVYAKFGALRGVMPDWTQWAAITNHVLAPSVVIRRAAVEQVGGFHPGLTHAVDWEMWMRLAAHFAVWHEPQPLACYRQHGQSETARQLQSGQNVADIARALEIARHYFPPQRADEMVALSKHHWALGATRGAQALLAGGEIIAALAQIREAAKLSCSTAMLRQIESGMLAHFDRYLQSLLPALQKHRAQSDDPHAAAEARAIRRRLVHMWLAVPAAEITIHLQQGELGRWHNLLREAGLPNTAADDQDRALLASMPSPAHATVISSLFPPM